MLSSLSPALPSFPCSILPTRGGHYNVTGPRKTKISKITTHLTRAVFRRQCFPSLWMDRRYSGKLSPSNNSEFESFQRKILPYKQLTWLWRLLWETKRGEDALLPKCENISSFKFIILYWLKFKQKQTLWTQTVIKPLISKKKKRSFNRVNSEAQWTVGPRSC